MSLLYFAYGSNLNRARMRQRVPSARTEAVAFLEHHRFVCSKRGRDGSAKANLVPVSGCRVWGVIYRIAQPRLALLDRFETGYERVDVEVHTAAGVARRASTYRSDRIIDAPVPFDWYRELILEGAREHGLPEEYLKVLEALPSRHDGGPGARN
jgi:cation transport regulator ChaC